MEISSPVFHSRRCFSLARPNEQRTHVRRNEGGVDGARKGGSVLLHNFASRGNGWLVYGLAKIHIQISQLTSATSHRCRAQEKKSDRTSRRYLESTNNSRKLSLELSLDVASSIVKSCRSGFEATLASHCSQLSGSSLPLAVRCQFYFISSIIIVAL